MIQGKRGSQVEMFISFVIFLAFLLFVYIILTSNTRVQKGKEEVLTQTREKLFAEMEDDVTTFTIQILKSPTSRQKCIKVQNIYNDISNQVSNPLGLIIQNSNKETLKYNFKNNGANKDLRIFISPMEAKQFDGILKFYSSGSLTPSYCDENTIIDGSKPCKKDDCYTVHDYTFSEIKNIEGANFLEKIIRIKDDYDTGYDLLKEDKLLLQEGTDFGFIFELADGTIIQPTTMEGKIPETASNIYSETKHLLYIDGNGETKVGFLTIKIW